MSITMGHLERCFECAKKENANFIGVAIWTRGNEGLEVIINPSENFNKKLEYYKKAYNDDLILKTYDGIKIVGFAYGKDFDELKSNLSYLIG